MSCQVIASMVVGANWATTLGGTSAPLRTAEDRDHFLALRRSPSIGAILVGGATAAVEPYQRAPHPLFIFDSTHVKPLTTFISDLCESTTGVILCEGGARLIHLLLAENMIDTFYLSRVAIDGDDHFLNHSLLLQRMSLSSSQSAGITTFERYERASR